MSKITDKIRDIVSRYQKWTHEKKLHRIIHYFIVIMLFLIGCYSVFFIIPYSIEYFIKLDSFLGIECISIFNKNRWFSFIASYLGVVGTVFLGTVALIQNTRLSKANDDLRNMQKNYFEVLTHPLIELNKEINFAELVEPKEHEKELKDNVKHFLLVHKDINQNYKNEKDKQLVRLCFSINNKSSVPIGKYKIEELSWLIDETQLEFEKVSSEYIMILRDKKLYINLLLVFPNKLYSLIKNHLDSNIDNSMIYLNLTIKNQINNEKSFNVSMLVHSFDNDMKIGLHEIKML